MPTSYEASLRHATYHLTVLMNAAELYSQNGDGMRLGLAQFDLAWENIRSAQLWCTTCAMDQYGAAQLCCMYSNAGGGCFSVRQSLSERLHWLEDGLAACQIIGDELHLPMILDGLGWVYVELGEPNHALEIFKQLLALHSDRPDPDLVNRIKSDKLYLDVGEPHPYEKLAYAGLGAAYQHLGDIPAAIQCFKKALTYFQQVGDQKREADTWGRLGNAYTRTGDEERRKECFQQQLLIAHQIGNQRLEAQALGSMGIISYDAKDNSKALDLFEQAKAQIHELGDRREEAVLLFNSGSVYFRQGDMSKAIDHYNRALRLAEAYGDPHIKAEILFALGKVYSDLNDLHKAVDLFETALPLFRQIGDRKNEWELLSCLGNISPPHQALEYYQQALALAREFKDTLEEGKILAGMSELLYETGNRKQAIQHAEMALKTLTKIQPRDDMLDLLEKTLRMSLHTWKRKW